MPQHGPIALGVAAAGEQGSVADAIGLRSGGLPRHHLEEGGVEVVPREVAVAHVALGHVGTPGNDGHARTALVEVPLARAQDAVVGRGGVRVERRVFTVGEAAVVTRKHDRRLVGDTEAAQGVEDAAHVVVDRLDHGRVVGRHIVSAGIAGLLRFVLRDEFGLAVDGDVGRVVVDVQEEGLALFGGLGNLSQRAVGEHVGEVVAPLRVAHDFGVGPGAVRVDAVPVGPVVLGVEPVAGCAAVNAGVAVLHGADAACVPLADVEAAVDAAAPQILGDRRVARCEVGLVVRGDDLHPRLRLRRSVEVLGDAETRGREAGLDGDATGAAHGPRGIAFAKTGALLRHAVEVGGFDEVVAVGADVEVPEVVGDDEDDVRSGRSGF